MEAAEREKRESELNIKREVVRNAEKQSRVEQSNMDGELDDREREERERRERSEVLRRQRSEVRTYPFYSYISTLIWTSANNIIFS